MIGWVDASAGASGDMLLGALLGAGVPLDVMSSAIDAVAPTRVRLHSESVVRKGFAAVRCHVEGTDSSTSRTWADISGLVTGRAHEVFERLATAEATVHGTSPDDVHFHEVGALDAIADIVGVCAGLEHLALDELVVSPVAVGSGSVATRHGVLPVPPPAVAELLRGCPTYAGPAATESCTPTGAALLTTFATSFGPQPPITVEQIGIGAGGRDPDTHANVLRLFVGAAAAAVPSSAVVLETNVDDLDPRLWPPVLAKLLDAGASDAWLTPILMKKGRPAHTLHVLVAADRLETVRRQVFRETSTIGVREIAVSKTALDRDERVIEIDGMPVRVKLASLDGERLNAQPEYVDLQLVADKTGRALKDVLAEAIAHARRL